MEYVFVTLDMFSLAPSVSLTHVLMVKHSIMEFVLVPPHPYSSIMFVLVKEDNYSMLIMYVFVLQDKL